MVIADVTDPTEGADPSAGARAARPEDPTVRAVLDDPRRLVPLEAIHNFRDLGGYELADGRTIGWGRLFRADGLYRATDLDVDTFDGIGLRTVVDLRSSPETAEWGSFPVDRHPVAYVHLPIIDATWREQELPEVDDSDRGTVDFLVWAYRDMLRAGGDRFAAAMHTLALPESMPAVFHCAAGKDRTGVLAALILGALGIDRQLVVADDHLVVDAERTEQQCGEDARAVLAGRAVEHGGHRLGQRDRVDGGGEPVGPLAKHVPIGPHQEVDRAPLGVGELGDVPLAPGAVDDRQVNVRHRVPLDGEAAVLGRLGRRAQIDDRPQPERIEGVHVELRGSVQPVGAEQPTPADRAAVGQFVPAEVAEVVDRLERHDATFVVQHGADRRVLGSRLDRSVLAGVVQIDGCHDRDGTDRTAA